MKPQSIRAAELRAERKAAGTYKRGKNSPRVWVDGAYVFMIAVPDPDDFGHPESDVRVGP